MLTFVTTGRSAVAQRARWAIAAAIIPAMLIIHAADCALAVQSYAYAADVGSFHRDLRGSDLRMLEFDR